MSDRDQCQGDFDGDMALWERKGFRLGFNGVTFQPGKAPPPTDQDLGARSAPNAGDLSIDEQGREFGLSD